VSRKVRPAEGEGCAAAGYRDQYFVGGLLILRGLRDGSLEWIRIKDADAGRVDDFVLGRDNQVDGYQVKKRAKPLSFRNFTGEGSEVERERATGSLVRQLAEGWRLLRQRHRRRAVVYLVTNTPPSFHDRINSTA